MWRSCHPEIIFHYISENCGSGHDLGNATGLQTVSTGRQGLASSKISSSKNPNDSQLLWAPLVQRFGWAAYAYHKKDGETPNPGEFKYSL